ncbi:hypothetical protein [Micromonospora inyonensis]|uniref:Uncharacterized protein n=1 Tax=Micromonospora inyonensis TaxID=47866 RepID=A0A1C6SNU4_9ACTN|nr:hypothetical protein [Micromonospora inyonensis]SCL31062.1 hypothetical protein GA0074694_5873 [Micromonospora inyonensis]
MTAVTWVPVITASATLLAAVLAGSVTIWNERRKRLLDARQAAYVRATSTLQLVRRHMLIEDMFAAQTDALRERLHRGANGNESRDLIQHTLETIERRRDRLLEHVLRPLLDAEAAVQVFGSAAVQQAMRDASGLVAKMLGPDPRRFDDERFEAAVRALREAIRRELRIR